MRLNKTHKQKLIAFALENIEVPERLTAKAATAQANAEAKVGEFFAKKLGPDLPTLKRHDVAERLKQVAFIATDSQREKYDPSNKYRFELVFNISDDAEVWDTMNKWYGVPYYTVTNPIFAAVYAANKAHKQVEEFMATAKGDFETLLARATTFKRACELWPAFENAAHLVMANTALATTDDELIAKVSEYTVAGNER